MRTSEAVNRRIAQSVLMALLACALIVSVARAQTVSVAFPNLADGQTVGGKLNLSVTVNAPQPIASVDYRLNDQSLAKITIAPFNYEWDTGSIAPGTYMLSAVVVDQAGNTGQAQVTLTVAKPVQVAISAAQDTIHVGDKVALNATVSALVDVARVELLIDQQSVSTATTQPFAFTFDSSVYQAGDHTVTIRAVDLLGRTGEASLTVQFLAADQTGWLRGLIIVAVIATISAAGLVLWRTLKMARRSYLRTARLELHNLGNTRSRYEVRAADAAGVLRYQLLLNEVALPATGGLAPAEAPTPKAAVGSSLRTTDNVKQSGGALADLLMSLGGLLPRSLGGPLLTAGSNLRQAQYTANRAQNVAGNLSAARPEPNRTPAKAEVAAVNALPVWQTPYLEPDDVLTLTLIIDPGAPRQTQQFAFRLTSAPIDQAGADEQTLDATLNIEGMSLWRMYLPFFIVAGVTLAILLIMALLLANSGVLS